MRWFRLFPLWQHCNTTKTAEMRERKVNPRVLITEEILELCLMMLNERNVKVSWYLTEIFFETFRALSKM